MYVAGALWNANKKAHVKGSNSIAQAKKKKI